MNWKMAYESHEKCAGMDIRTIADIEKAGFPVVDASVPGNLEIDLMREGKLPDLYYSTNVLEARKLEATHVWYFTKVNVNHPGQYLHFEGIDTFADIYVNGKLTASADNMFLPVDVKADWIMGFNEVLVHIKPAMLETRKFVSPVACNALPYNYPTLYGRKAAHMYGWDIMPRIVSAGIWKDVTLREERADKLCEVYFAVNKIDLEAGTARMRVFVNTDLSGSFATDYSVKVEGRCGESTFEAEKTLWHTSDSFVLGIENCQFWWPKNAGAPNLYDTTVTLKKGEEIRNVLKLKVGIRTVELERTEMTTEQGDGEFCFKINGKKIFVMGTNWVPLDSLHSRDPQRLDRALDLLNDVGCNMVRCWGGNVYESDAFYDFCDAHGILVWQDFAMGCAVYPRDTQFREALTREAVYQIKRLRNHPALALWVGDNENDLSCYEWNGFKRNPNQNTLTRELLAEQVLLHDYTRPYLPSSPYMSEAVFQGKGLMPENHLWGPRDYFKGEFYRNSFCHFVSETGYQAMPSTGSLRKFLVHPETMFKEDGNPTEEYQLHATSMETIPGATYSYRIPVTYKHVCTLFHEVRQDLDGFVRQSQISQAEAVKYFIEKFRIGKWKRTGIIWWNLLDGWPQVSDAVVDYYFCKKLAYHYIKRSQAPVCLMFDEPVDGRLALMGVNDLPTDCEVSYKVRKYLPNGTWEEVLNGRAVLKTDTSGEVDAIRIEEGEKCFLLIEWEKDGRKYKNHYFTHIIDIDYGYYSAAQKACGMDNFEQC